MTRELINEILESVGLGEDKSGGTERLPDSREALRKPEKNGKRRAKGHRPAVKVSYQTTQTEADFTCERIMD